MSETATEYLDRQERHRKQVFDIIERWRETHPIHDVRMRLEDTTWFPAYAEPGYDDPTGAGIVAANWNEPDRWVPPADGSIDYWGSREEVDPKRTMTRLNRILERLGVETQWSDEWSACSGCGKALRTQPDSYFWTPSYRDSDIENGEILCPECQGPPDWECPDCGCTLDGTETDCPYCAMKQRKQEVGE